MGWLKPKPSSTPDIWHQSDSSPNSLQHTTTIRTIIDGKDLQKKPSAQHLERIDSHHADNSSSSEGNPLLYPFQLPHLKDADLPFIPPSVVSAALQELNRVWIVIDNIVFDATGFLHEHPGGNTVIESFAGQDCSWQFWRFHSRKHMRETGVGLRVGRTVGVTNKFVERPRFVGLRKLDVWD